MECEACFLQMVIEQGWNIDKVHEQSMCIIKSLHPACNLLLVFVVGQIESLEENYTPHRWEESHAINLKCKEFYSAAKCLAKNFFFWQPHLEVTFTGPI